jgi:hypothetical protein
VSRGRWIAVTVAAALLYALAAEARLGYDAVYQLVWGRDLLGGALPRYDVRLAPTPHPLQVLGAAPLSLLGQAADEALRAVSLLSLALLAAGVWRAGERLFSTPVGVLAAAVVITRPHLIEMAYLGDADIPAAALCIWAAVRALDGQPTAALVLLVLAGLLRPEAWLLSLAYAAWLQTQGELSGFRLALVAAAPVLWALSDLAVTGDALWSLHHTRTGTDLLDRPTGAAEAVKQLPRHLNFLLGTQVLVVGAFGFVAGLIAARRRMRPLVAVLVLLGGAFGALALAGLSLQPRYLAGLAAAIAVCAGLGGVGWGVLGERWRPACIVGLVGLASSLPFDAAEFANVRSRVVDDGRELEALARGPARATIRDCHSVAVPSVRPIPYLAFWTRAEPDAFVETGAPPTSGTLITPTETNESWIGGGEDQPPRVVSPLRPGFHDVAANGAWRVYAAC